MAKSSGMTRTYNTKNGADLSKRELEIASEYGFEIYKERSVIQFGKPLEYTFEVSYNYDSLTKEQIKKAEKIAIKKGGHYDSEFKTFSMTTQSKANEMVRELLKIKKK